MRTELIKLGTKLGMIGALSLGLTACYVAPVQPVGYRVTTSTLPAYDSTVVQTTTPVYSYTYPYYSSYPSYYYPNYPYYDPWYGLGVGLGIGAGIGIWSGHGWHRGGHRGGWGGRGWRR